ncbi:hypothetical protein KR093_011469 [Drosophila rubida]|uniref:Solute carrier family 3 member 2 N-terminal domain-containing protein n=1 Tax=Drosophila rubida TaxID=30044 RepID=A0AAD4JWK1_9MUSC|nr:hypothetical protein KR093_011469 [Drosophila rubida]
MSSDERTALLAAQQLQRARGQQEQQQHIIVVPLGRDPKDYEPVFTTADHSYGLTLDELLPFAADPWWQKVRRLSTACLWLTFLLTLLAAIAMAYFHDNVAVVCRPNRVITTTLPPLSLALANNTTLLLSG